MPRTVTVEAVPPTTAFPALTIYRLTLSCGCVYYEYRRDGEPAPTIDAPRDCAVHRGEGAGTLANVVPRSAPFTCPACTAGAMALSVEMAEHTIFACSGCKSSLWVPTATGLRKSVARVKRRAHFKRVRSVKASANE
jgi:hypothetical protein